MMLDIFDVELPNSSVWNFSIFDMCFSIGEFYLNISHPGKQDALDSQELMLNKHCLY